MPRDGNGPMRGIMDHPAWDELKPYLEIEFYDRDGGHENPRIRIELKHLPAALSHRLQRIVMPCISCTKQINPLRRRKGSTHSSLYYACSCPLEESLVCCRGSLAAQEYERFRNLDTGGLEQMEMFR